MTGPWVPDILGDGYEQRALPLADGTEATLVRYLPASGPAHERGPRTAGLRRRAVLYVHGYNDYFFQRHLAEAWHSHGYDFYALDLHGCGRSWREGQLPHYCTDLREYTPELTEAARIVRQEEGHDQLVVNAHSTGGLTVSLWAHSMRNKVVVDALVLNSPWFDLNDSWFHRTISTRLVDAVGPLDPERVLSAAPSRYAELLHVDAGGAWDYDRALKSPAGVPARTGWLRAIRRGHARLARGLDIRVPVLVCVSARSGRLSEDDARYDTQDVVLDVEQIVARAPLLGGDVTVVRIEGGAHDLALSAPEGRAEYLRVVFAWLADRLGG